MAAVEDYLNLSSSFYLSLSVTLPPSFCLSLSLTHTHTPKTYTHRHTLGFLSRSCSVSIKHKPWNTFVDGIKCGNCFAELVVLGEITNVNVFFVCRSLSPINIGISCLNSIASPSNGCIVELKLQIILKRLCAIVT